MHLEEHNIDVVMANSELLVACYFIVESAVSYLSNPENHLSGILKQSRRIQQALNNAFMAILKFLHELSTNVLPNDPKVRLFYEYIFFKNIFGYYKIDVKLFIDFAHIKLFKYVK